MESTLQKEKSVMNGKKMELPPSKKGFSVNNTVIPIHKNYEVVCHVYRTSEYDKFKMFKGNRNVIPRHLQNLIASYEKEQLIVPVIVNEKMEIIDGQHRYFAAKDRKLPVYFIICEGYGIDQIQMLNSNQANWSVEDFWKFYCEEGYPQYIAYRDFRLKFGFGHQESVAMLTASTTNQSKAFIDGELEIDDMAKAEETAAKILMFKPYYKGFNRKSFVFAIIKLLREIPGYDNDEMVKKVKQQQMRLVDCSTTKQYLMLLEEIFNYHRRGDKLRFI